MLAFEDDAAQAPFGTPEGLVFTSRHVMYEGWPILLVSHDADDEAWQFVNGDGNTDEGVKPMLVHPEHVVELDPSVLVLADLPLGWQAWRGSVQDEWRREPSDASD